MYKGSKSQFGYLLMSFTFASSIQHLTMFLIFLYPVQVTIENTTKYLPNEYVAITNNCLYWLLQLQPWIFAMKYIYSGSQCSLEPTILSLSGIKYMNWGGVILYAGCMIVFWCIEMATWSGYTEIPNHFKWDQAPSPLYFTTQLIWVVYTIASTIITIIGIRQILTTLKELKKYNERIKMNSFTLKIHCTVLVLNFLAVFIDAFPYRCFSEKTWLIFDIMLVGADTITQLCICYICWSMGSSAMLN